jgi:hypothetical protein
MTIGSSIIFFLWRWQDFLQERVFMGIPLPSCLKQRDKNKFDIYYIFIARSSLIAIDVFFF